MEGNLGRYWLKSLLRKGLACGLVITPLATPVRAAPEVLSPTATQGATSSPIAADGKEASATVGGKPVPATTTATAASITVGTTEVLSGTSGNLLSVSGSLLGEVATKGSGDVVRESVVSGNLAASGYLASSQTTGTTTGYGFANNEGPSIYMNGTSASALGYPGGMIFYAPNSSPILTVMDSGGNWTFDGTVSGVAASWSGSETVGGSLNVSGGFTSNGVTTFNSSVSNQSSFANSGTYYATGSTNTQNCTVLGDGNSVTAQHCMVLSTTSSGNNSQMGLAVSLQTNTGVSSAYGGESVAGYFSNFGTSTSQKLWGLTSTVALNGPNGANGEEIVLGNGYCDPGDPWNPSGCTAGASFLLLDANGTASEGQYQAQSVLYITNAQNNSAISHVGIFMGQNAGATASITDAGIADFTGDFSIIRAGGTHTHFYYPEPTYTPASYTGTMWFGELTVGNAGVGGAMLQLINSAGACTLTPPATTFSCTSDARLKTDYGLVGDQLNYLDSLPVHSYKINASGERTLGPIAQELQKIHPEMVHEVEDELLPADKENEKGTMLAVDGVNPWALVKAIQELNAEAKRQESQIRVLTRRVNKLERAANENHRHGSHSSRRRRA